MNGCNTKLSPGELQASDAHRKRISDFWNELRTCGDPGATNWEALESLENEVTECLYLSPPDLVRADSLTAKAALLIGGFDEP